MSRFHVRTRGLVVAAASVFVVASSALAGAPVTYKTSGSFFEGCMGVCQCVVTFLSPMEGSYRLQLTEASDNELTFAVTDLSLDVTQYAFSIEGGGTYTQFSKFAISQQIILDVVYTSDGEERHFESETTLVDDNFPNIGVKTIFNGDPTCYGTILGIDSSPVFGDITGDAIVDVDDLLAVINGWGDCGATCNADVAPEFTGNAVVDVDDLLLVINNWGM